MTVTVSYCNTPFKRQVHSSAKLSSGYKGPIQLPPICSCVSSSPSPIGKSGYLKDYVRRPLDRLLYSVIKMPSRERGPIGRKRRQATESHEQDQMPANMLHSAADSSTTPSSAQEAKKYKPKDIQHEGEGVGNGRIQLPFCQDRYHTSSHLRTRHIRAQRHRVPNKTHLARRDCRDVQPTQKRGQR